MMNEEHDKIKLKFPLWQYLTQPVFSPQFKSLNPMRFWQLHILEQLEVVWSKSQDTDREAQDLAQFLENCWARYCWRPEPRRDDEEVIEWLERCWSRSQSRSKGFFDESEERY